MVAELDVLDSREAGGKVIRGGGLRIGSYVGGLLIGLISAPLLVRHLSIEDYGLFVTVSSIVFVVAGITEGGLGNVAVRTYALADPEERTRLLDGLLGLRLVLTAAGLRAGASSSRVVAGYPSEVTIGTALAGVGTLHRRVAVHARGGAAGGAQAGIAGGRRPRAPDRDDRARRRPRDRRRRPDRLLRGDPRGLRGDAGRRARRHPGHGEAAAGGSTRSAGACCCARRRSTRWRPRSASCTSRSR